VEVIVSQHLINYEDENRISNFLLLLLLLLRLLFLSFTIRAMELVITASRLSMASSSSFLHLYTGHTGHHQPAACLRALTSIQQRGL